MSKADRWLAFRGASLIIASEIIFTWVTRGFFQSLLRGDTPNLNSIVLAAFVGFGVGIVGPGLGMVGLLMLKEALKPKVN